MQSIPIEEYNYWTAKIVFNIIAIDKDLWFTVVPLYQSLRL